MNILTLIIKQSYFDEIIAGKKKEEYREVKPTTASKYIYYVDEQGNQYKPSALPPEDVPLEERLIEYDAIQFYVGYNADRDSALVEVKDAVLDIYENETYEYKGEEYMLSVITYKLGKILEVKKK